MSQQAQPGDESDPAARAADPSTPQTELHQLSASRPELRPLIAENPNAYPQLLEWLGGLNDPEVDAALARRGAAGQTRPLNADDAVSAGTPAEQTEEFGAVQQPHSEPAHSAQTPPSDFDQQVYGAPTAAHSAPERPQQPVYAQHPRSAYPPQGYEYAPAPLAEPEAQPRRRRGGGCVIVLLLGLITAAALAASYLLLFGNPLSSDEESAPTEQQQEADPDGGQPQGDAASPEDSPSPTEDAAEEDGDEEEQARPAPDDSLDITAFSAPSGNIHCTLNDSDVLCTIDEHFFDAPSGCDDTVTVRVGSDGSAETACDENVDPQGENLAYGETTGNDDFACEATQTHFECWSQQSGNGFQLAREYYELYDY